MVKIDKRVIVISIIIIVVIEFCAILKLDHFFYDSWHWLALSESIYEGKGYCFNPDYFHDKYLSDRPLLKGECPTRMRQPGFALFLVLAYWLPGQNLLFFKIVQAVLSLFSFLFAILIARKIFVNSSSLNIFVVLMALYFPLWILVTYIMSETLFTFLLVAAMYLFDIRLCDARPSYYSSSRRIVHHSVHCLFGAEQWIEKMVIVRSFFRHRVLAMGN
jgi:dolichyl-phosphate-mannose--protein O-mannosyl transferase